MTRISNLYQFPTPEKKRILFLGTIFMEKSQQSVNSCRVPQQHLQSFKTWNDFVSACEIPDLSKTWWNNPDLPTFTFIVLSQCWGTQSQEPRFIKYEAVCMFWTESRHQEAAVLLVSDGSAPQCLKPPDWAHIRHTESPDSIKWNQRPSCRLHKHDCIFPSI